jgi:hypothetical protein
MNTVEDKIRAATRAEAATLREIRPLRLPTAAPTQLRMRPAARIRRGRFLKTWATPVSAAAAVLALAISLVIVRDMPNGRVVAPVGPVRAIAGVPRYYVTLYTPPQPPNAVAVPCKAGTPPTACPGPVTDLLVGDTFTGATLAVVAPPAGTNFSGVAAAADDLTFAVDTTAMTVAGTRTWYLLRITPGTRSPARLTRLPIPALSTTVDAMALSGSGRELAVAMWQRKASTSTGELRIYSVATGRLLRVWSTKSPDAFGDDAYYGEQSRALTWIDGDRAVAFFASWTGYPAALTTAAASVDREKGLTRTQREEKLQALYKRYGGASMHMAWRRLDVAATSGDLMADSKVIWSSTSAPEAYSSGCEYGWIQLISADGKTVMCSSVALLRGTERNPLSSRVAWLAISIPTGAVRTLYQFTVDGNQTAFFDGLWTSTSGDKLIVEWGPTTNGPASSAHFGVLSHGTFQPIPAPTQAGAVAPSVTWLGPPDSRSPRPGESNHGPFRINLNLIFSRGGTRAWRRTGTMVGETPPIGLEGRAWLPWGCCIRVRWAPPSAAAWCRSGMRCSGTPPGGAGPPPGGRWPPS